MRCAFLPSSGGSQCQLPSASCRLLHSLPASTPCCAAGSLSLSRMSCHSFRHCIHASTRLLARRWVLSVCRAAAPTTPVSYHSAVSLTSDDLVQPTADYYCKCVSHSIHEVSVRTAHCAVMIQTLPLTENSHFFAFFANDSTSADLHSIECIHAYILFICHAAFGRLSRCGSECACALTVQQAHLAL